MPLSHSNGRVSNLARLHTANRHRLWAGWLRCRSGQSSGCGHRAGVSPARLSRAALGLAHVPLLYLACDAANLRVRFLRLSPPIRFVRYDTDVFSGHDCSCKRNESETIDAFIQLGCFTFEAHSLHCKPSDFSLWHRMLRHPAGVTVSAYPLRRPSRRPLLRPLPIARSKRLDVRRWSSAKAASRPTAREPSGYNRSMDQANEDHILTVA